MKEIIFIIVVALILRIVLLDSRQKRARDELYNATRNKHVERTMYIGTTVWSGPGFPENYTSAELNPPTKEDWFDWYHTIYPGEGEGYGEVWEEFYNAEDLPWGTSYHRMRACHMIIATYTGALKELRQFFDMRYFYENNLEFEVGYLINEIISKYQRMIEIYSVIRRRFVYHEFNTYVQVPYILYMYTLVLEMGTVVAHLVNMLTQLEPKYAEMNSTGFDDYHIPPETYLIRPIDEWEKAVAAYQKQLRWKKRMKAKQNKKKRQEKLFIGYIPTTPERKPRRGRWPLEYGWSIEDWW